MDTFTHEWIDLADNRILYIRQQENDKSDTWLKFLEDILGNFDRDEALIIVNITGVSTNFDIDSFKKHNDLLRNFGIMRAHYAVISENPQDELMLRLFNDFVQFDEYDAEAKLFSTLDLAKEWLANTTNEYAPGQQCCSR